MHRMVAILEGNFLPGFCYNRSSENLEKKEWGSSDRMSRQLKAFHKPLAMLLVGIELSEFDDLNFKRI